MRDRHFHLEAHPEEKDKPVKDEMTKLTDQWIAHMESIDGADARWKIQPRPVDRRKPGEKANNTPRQETPILPPQVNQAQQSSNTRSNKRNRDASGQQRSFSTNTQPLSSLNRNIENTDALGQMSQQDQMDAVYGLPSQSGSYTSVYPPASKRQKLGEKPDQPQRVVVEGGMTKEDWLEVVGQVKAHDPRIPAMEQKIDTLIDTTRRTHQLLIQLLKNQARRPGQAGNLGVNGAELNMNVNGEASGVGE